MFFLMLEAHLMYSSFGAPDAGSILSWQPQNLLQLFWSIAVLPLESGHCFALAEQCFSAFVLGTAAHSSVSLISGEYRLEDINNESEFVLCNCTTYILNE